MRVLILGARAPACLEWARAFHAAGARVVAADCLQWPLTRFSSAISRYVCLPEPRSNLQAWVDALRHTIHTEQIDRVIPTCEEAFYLAHVRDALPCLVMTSDFALMRSLHHKGEFAAMTQGWPVHAPETHLLESHDHLTAFTAPEHWVFKPAYSRFAHQTLIRPNHQALARLQPTPETPWVAQAFIEGREYCSFSVLDQGRLIAHACYQPRYRVGRGSGIWFDPAQPADIRAFIEHFGRTTGYTGQVGFDFMQDTQGQFHVLECNPRGTSGIHLFDRQGQALIAALHDHAPVLIPDDTPRQVALAMVVFGIGKYGLSRQFWHDLTHARDVITRKNDTGPLWAQLPGLLEIIGRALSRRCSLLAAATADCEWNGQPLAPVVCN